MNNTEHLHNAANELENFLKENINSLTENLKKMKEENEQKASSTFEETKQKMTAQYEEVKNNYKKYIALLKEKGDVQKNKFADMLSDLEQKIREL